MKLLCLVLIIALGVPGCSMFDRRSRQERAYSKYLKQTQTAGAKRRQSIIKQRAEMPSPPTAPPPQENVQPPENE